VSGTVPAKPVGMKPPIAEIELLIRCPAAEAYRAFVEPEMLTQFWLAKASQPLAPNTRVRWEFLVPGAAATLQVRSMSENHHIATAWDDDTTIDFTFNQLEPELTLVRITQAGFSGSPDEVVAKALDATQGFTLVLCELKARLEQNLSLNAVRDKARSIEQAKARRS
jgi:uncharacterized protein YndB with AHSA1/START domain